jgi:site-specific DNA recombinase
LKASLYLRVSTEDQARNGWSIEGQYDDLRDYCNRKKYKVVRVYKDEGFSGSNLERPALKKMLADASNNVFDVVVVWKYDRLSRDEIDFPLIIHNLKKFDINVESMNEPTPNDGSPYSEFIVGLLGLMASLERKMFLMRSKMGQKIRFKNGLYLGGTPPYGYSYNEESGELELHPVESKYAKIIFEKYREFNNLNSVRNYLEKEGAPTKRSARWCSQSIRRILSNRIYIGEYSFGDMKIQKENYKLIDEELFNEVQEHVTVEDFGEICRLCMSLCSGRMDSVKLNI